MNHRNLIAVTFVALATVGAFSQLRANPALATTAVAALRVAQPPQQTGSFPAQWDAGNDCAHEADFQVHAYNDDFYVIRQSKCVIFEAPFLYLIFGDDMALLMDTGSNFNSDVYGTVRRVIVKWARDHSVAIPPLIVAHTHAHGDHTAGDAQFIGQPDVLTVVAPGQQAVSTFWGFQNWPHDIPTFDLGNRVLDVIATPGHQGASIALYDRRTQLLLTGDTVYPGHLFVFSPNGWTMFVDSLRRLIEFARLHPVEWVVGCHIEMSATPFAPYAYGTPAHPNERKLEFRPRKLSDIYRAAQSMNGDPECTVFEDFVIHPIYKCGVIWNG